MLIKLGNLISAQAFLSLVVQDSLSFKPFLTFELFLPFPLCDADDAVFRDERI